MWVEYKPADVEIDDDNTRICIWNAECGFTRLAPTESGYILPAFVVIGEKVLFWFLNFSTQLKTAAVIAYIIPEQAKH